MGGCSFQQTAIGEGSDCIETAEIHLVDPHCWDHQKKDCCLQVDLVGLLYPRSPVKHCLQELVLFLDFAAHVEWTCRISVQVNVECVAQ